MIKLLHGPANGQVYEDDVDWNDESTLTKSSYMFSKVGGIPLNSKGVGYRNSLLSRYFACCNLLYWTMGMHMPALHVIDCRPCFKIESIRNAIDNCDDIQSDEISPGKSNAHCGDRAGNIPSMVPTRKLQFVLLHTYGTTCCSVAQGCNKIVQDHAWLLFCSKMQLP